jgi:hypothetical protein
VEASRTVLAHQLYAALRAAGNEAAAATISTRFRLHGQPAPGSGGGAGGRLFAPPTAAAALGLGSQSLLTGGGGGSGAGGGGGGDGASPLAVMTANQDVRESGAWLASLLQSHDSRAGTMLQQLQEMESEREGLRGEVLRLRDALTASRGHAAALQQQLTLAGAFSRAAGSASAHEPIPVERGPVFPGASRRGGGGTASHGSLSSHFTGDLGPASPPDVPGSFATPAHGYGPRAGSAGAGAGGAGGEVAALRQRCGELEEQTERFRTVIADMRAHMEQLQVRHGR